MKYKIGIANISILKHCMGHDEGGSRVSLHTEVSLGLEE